MCRYCRGFLNWPTAWLVFLVGTVFLLGGCGPSGPEMGQVTGKVTFDGSLVTKGTVQFWPANGRPSRGSIQEDGTYQLTTFESNDGALVGDHVVTIKSTQLSEAQPEIESTAAEIAHFRQKNVKPIRASRVVWIVPKKYSESDTSPLVANVSSGDNEINFEIEKD